MTLAAYVPMRLFSARVSPLPTAVMAIFRAYGDESFRADGVEGLPGVHSFVTYYATLEVWTNFERLWKQVLDKHEVEYLHMNELTQFVGPFAKWKGKEDARRAFIIDCVQAVRDAGTIEAVGGVVLCNDLARFNADYGQSIEPYSFCLSAALLGICHFLPNESVEVRCDKIDKFYLKAHKALGYLAHDPKFDAGRDCITALPTPEGQSSKTVLPLQLADFGAWEARKAYDLSAGWLRDHPDANEGDFKKQLDSYMAWAFKWSRQRAVARDREPPKSYRWPDWRKSRLSLQSAAPIECPYWDYGALVRTSERKGHRWTD
jgi:hypothetical protein